MDELVTLAEKFKLSHYPFFQSPARALLKGELLDDGAINEREICRTE